MRSYVWDSALAGVHFCFSGYFSALGKSKISFFHNIIAVVTARIPIAYFASVRYPDTLFPMGFAALVGSAVSVVICVAAYIYLNKKEKEFTEDENGTAFEYGEVSRLFSISPETLRHYEKMGILTPERIDESSGFRYYGTRQFEVLNTVKYLRMLDMPLEEIAGFLKNRDVSVIKVKARKAKKDHQRKKARA